MVGSTEAESPVLEELGLAIADQGAWGSLAPSIASQPHSLLGSVAATCDLFACGPNKQLRVFNAKGSGALRCSRVLVPQLLDESFVRRHPDFWRESARQQEELVDEAHGGRALDVPFAVLQLSLLIISSLNLITHNSVHHNGIQQVHH